MKNWKRLFALLLALTFTVSLCACKNDADDAQTSAGESSSGGFLDFFKGLFGSGDSEPSASPSEEPDPSPSSAPSVEVDLTQDILAFSAGMSAGDELLTVNGQAVAADLFLYILAMNCSQASMYASLMGKTMEEMAPDLLNDSVSVTATQILIQQKAAELGCLPTDAQAAEARENMKADGQENYDLMKAAYGLSDKSMEYMFLSDAYYENLLDAVVPDASDEMLNSYVYQAKHILVKTVDDNQQPLADGIIDEKKAQAEDILAQLRAADDLEAKFDELMNEYSEDGRNEDGSLAAPDGYTAVLGDMVSEFEAGALTLKPGEISDLIETRYGFHIILRGEVADIQSYAEECRQYHLQQELNALLEDAKITRAPALDALDVAGFYEKYSAYQNAVIAASQPAETDPVEPVASDGVG